MSTNRVPQVAGFDYLSVRAKTGSIESLKSRYLLYAFQGRSDLARPCRRCQIKLGLPAAQDRRITSRLSGGSLDLRPSSDYRGTNVGPPFFLPGRGTTPARPRPCMNFRSLFAIFPCQSLEDLSLRRSASEAQQLLAAFTALWHPVLIARAESVPAWGRAESPPEALADALVVVPGCCQSLVTAEWPDQARAAGAVVLEGIDDRREIVATALAQVDDLPEVDPDLAADFHALGYAYLVVELLTRQLRYMSNLDELALQNRAVDAARAALVGNAEEAREQLRAAFQVIHEAREYFYPVDLHLIDLTLVADTTIDASLIQELECGTPVNVMLPGDVIEKMASDEPQTLAALKRSVDTGGAALVGGGWSELPLAWVGLETIRRDLELGLDAFERHLGQKPMVFGRRRYGLSPILPGVLFSHGFVGALHFTLDDGQFPTTNQSRIRWQGVDGSAIEVLGKIPLDASKADWFLRLSERVGDAMDLDHTATLIFAHWPCMAACWYDDLRRVTRYSSVLGTFKLLPQYFRDTNLSGQPTKHRADSYHAPYLTQMAEQSQSDPLSRFARYWQDHAQEQQLATLAAMGQLLGASDTTKELNTSCAEGWLSDPPDESPRNLAESLAAETERIARLVSTQPGGNQGNLWVNPTGIARRIAVTDAAGQATSLDLPPFGWAWVEAKPAGSGKKQSVLAEDNVVRNEFFEVTLNRTTGAIQSILEYDRRGNRMAQQLAMRLPVYDYSPEAWYDQGGTSDFTYSVMAADEFKITSTGPIVGEITVDGRLMHRDGSRLANFTQVTRTRRGSRVVELEIKLDIEREVQDEPWRSYYCARFAWDSDSAEILRSVHQIPRLSDAPRMEAPLFLEIGSGRNKSTLLPCGLPCHRRNGFRMLDTILIAKGERARTFRLGIGIGLPYSLPAAFEMLTPPLCVAAARPAAEATARSLVTVRPGNVVATSLESLFEEGKLAGFRVHLLECAGQTTPATIEAFATLKSACLKNLADAVLTELAVSERTVELELGSHQWAHVECRLA